MNGIEVKVSKTSYENLNINTLSCIPVLSALKAFWQGSDEEFEEYMLSINIDINQKHYESLMHLHNEANKNIDKIQEAFNNKNVGKFDFRLASVIKPRFFRHLSEDEYSCIEFSLREYTSDIEKNKIKDFFFKIKTRSLIDFRSIENDTLKIFYNKRALGLEDGRIVLANARDKISLAENFKVAKDNNFISSHICTQFANFMLESDMKEDFFFYRYMLSNGAINEKKMSMREIIQIDKMTSEQKDEAKRKDEIRNMANEEVKQELSLNRASLNPEENETQILKPSSSTVKFDSAILKNDTDLSTLVKSLFDEYKEKEIEKAKIRLDKAQKDGEEAYISLKANLNNGMTLLDSINYIKQKYRNDDTVNFASLLLTKDILEIVRKDNKILDLKANIQENELEISKITELVAKRENTIKELQSTLTKKNNEINIMNERHEESMQILIKESENNIKAIQDEIDTRLKNLNDEFRKDINERDVIIDEQEKFIAKLKFENDRFKEEIDKNKEIQSKNENLMNENIDLKKQLQDKDFDFKQISTDKTMLENKNKDLEQQIANLSEIKNEKERLFLELEQMKIKEKFLNEKIEEYKNRESKNEEFMQKFFSNNSNNMENNSSKEKVRNDEKRVAEILGEYDTTKKRRE